MPERRVDVTVVRWYERRDWSVDVAGRWMRAAREYLPEAVPVRFGDTEPLRGRFDTAGELGLTEAWQRAQGLLFLRCNSPILHASWSAPNVPKYWGRVGGHSVETTLPITDARLRQFALGFTNHRTIYVSASIRRADESSGEPYLAPLGQWHGPPPQPPPWCWFGPDYARKLRRHIDAEVHGAGLLYSGGRWIPDRYAARFDQLEPSHRRAARIPRGLR